MSPRRIAAVARKEAIHILRDPRSLAVAIAIPMLMLLLFGYALTLDVDRVPLIIWDQSETGASRELISYFLGSRYFSLRAYARNYGEVTQAIDSGEALIALVIPREFARQLESGRASEVQVIADASDANTATLALGYAEAASAAYSRELVLRQFRRMGIPPPRPALDARARVWFNPDMESKNFIVPGLIAVIMMVIAALLTSLTVSREWERGTMEQLISTPIRGPELIAGKLIPYFGLGILDVLIAVLMGQFLFHVPLRGSPLLLFGMASVFLMGALSLGILISVGMRTQLLASQVAMVATFLPAFLLSGFMFAIANMPRAIQLITYVVPARYFIVVMRGIYLKGVGLEILGFQALFLAVFALVTFTLANVMFRKKLA